jgi:hypothetical protein
MADTKPREAYEPPRISRVRLVADEVAVGHCKSVRVGPPASLMCNNGGVITAKTIGS